MSLTPSRWRLVALVLGALSILCALAVPFMPVWQDTARIEWPDGNSTRAVNAPLTGYWAQELDANLPCATIHGLDEAADTPARLLSTVPRGRLGTGAGMNIHVDGGLLTVENRGQEVVSQPLPQSGCDVRFHSTGERTTVTIAGQNLYDNEGDVRPRVVGIYSDVDAKRDPTDGLQVAVTPDTRYQSSPTIWKTLTTIIGVLALIGCLIAVNRLDARVARRAPRWAPIGWWKLTSRDLTVVGALGLWVFIGPVTSDDGYILSMAQAAGDAGYLTNYHRWFGVAEAPFGWFYHLTELMTQVTSVPPWIRLPSFALAVLAWLLISREILPRLGPQVRRSQAAQWAAASVFLVWWMPFNNGVRPEPVAAVGSLLAIAAVERTLVTRRMLPLCLGLGAAALTLAATPTGLIAIAPFIVAARPLWRLLAERARQGWENVLVPIGAAGFAVLFVVFADQTFASVAEATRIRQQVGPSLAWFQEFARYDLLFGGGGDVADDSLTRRFPVLLILLCVAACLVVILRKGRIPGAALGPSRRLIGTVVAFFLLLALTPTKWTHHFGAFAAVGSAMAALTALATSASVLRSNRNRNAFLAGLLVVAALATTGPNSYWFVSKLGVPWADTSPGFGPVKLATLLLIGAVVAGVVAWVQNVRSPKPGGRNPVADKPPTERRSRALMLSSASLTIVCGLMALSEFATVAAAVYNQNQRDSYSPAAANIEHVVGGTCNLSDHVLVEREPAATVLSAYPGARQVTAPEPDEESENDTDSRNGEQDSEDDPLPPSEEDNGQSTVGFHEFPLGSEDPIGSPPHSFGDERVPMWSSFKHQDVAAGTLRSPWFSVDQEDFERQLVVSVANGSTLGVSLLAEYAVPTDDGFEVVNRRRMPIPTNEESQWEDSRIPQRGLDPEVTAVRIVASDTNITEEGWIAVSAPRVPKLTTLTKRLSDEPVYMDWPTPFVYPCVRLPRVRDGISEMPTYRITPGDLANEAGWAGSNAGGPIGWLETVADMPEMPSVLRGDTSEHDLTWGQLLEVDPLEHGRPPTVIRGRELRAGWSSPGPGPMQPDGRTPTR